MGITALDISVVQGNNIRLVFTVRNKSGTPVDITGYYIKWQIRKNNKTTPFAIKTTSDGNITIVNASQGVFQIVLNTFDTLGMAIGDYIHETIVLDTSGNLITLRDYGKKPGTFTILERYTSLYMIQASYGIYKIFGNRVRFDPHPPYNYGDPFNQPIFDGGTQHINGIWDGFDRGQGN